MIIRVVAAVLGVLCGTALAEVDPETVFRNPPGEARTGVWWHWMGTGVSKEGIVRDLDWFREMGIGSVTIFAMADSALPDPLELKGGPQPDLVAATPDWWKLVRFATEEAVKRGVEVGIHNCPGYTHTGGPWIRPKHAMRDLVFEIPGKTAVTNYIDKRAVATVDVKGEKVVISHVAKYSFNYPAQKAATGFECDKMSAEAVNAHWDRVLADVKEHLGDLVGRGFNFIHIDSYEAKRPTWTPLMREEFRTRRGYDPVPFLPVLAGMDCCPPEKAKAFQADFAKTIRELYRDNVFRLSAERIQAAGLAFACEPYGDSPIDQEMCGVFVDRLLTEFWTGGEPWEEPMPPPEKWRRLMNWTGWTRVRDGRHPNVIAAEAFTGWPESSQWSETPARLKRVGDYRYVTGINHFVLHSVAHQPWGDGIRPGMTFGCWGTHLGRTQTWARDGKAWFDYLNRCQALLQWGEPVPSREYPLAEGLAQCVRKDGRVVVRFVVNATEREAVWTARGEWFDPVSGTVGPPPKTLAPGQSGFLVTGRPGKPAYAGTAMPVPFLTLEGPWTIEWKSAAQGTAPLSETQAESLFDWTKSENPEIRHFSGTAVYRTTFDCAEPIRVVALSLGDIRDQLARVRLNGVDLGVVWCAPTRVAVPDGLVKATGNRLEIEHTNVWANRLIGDEAYPPLVDWKRRTCLNRVIGSSPRRYPDFLATGRLPEGTRRSTFSFWNYFTKDSPLVPSGLLGPVILMSRPVPR